MKVSKVLLCPAAGPGVGGGHVLRCLTLAQALSARGVACTFGVGADGAGLLQRFAGDAYVVSQAPIADLLQTQNFDVLVIDDYAIGREEEASLRRRVGGLAVIDDLADRAHAAELLIDGGYGRRAEDYHGLVPAQARLLVGPAFALVRPAFAALRDQAMTRPPSIAPHRAFVSFGLSDVAGIAGRATALIRARYPSLRLDVALACDAVSLSGLQARAVNDAHLHLHVDARDMAALMAGADLAIGAGGGSTWERACLGLPTLAVIVADNQRGMIEAMAAGGVLLAVDLQAKDFDSAFNAALERLDGPQTRSALTVRSAALCDGLGAGRIAEAILAL